MCKKIDSNHQQETGEWKAHMNNSPEKWEDGMLEKKTAATKNHRFLDFQDIQSIARQCLEALDFLHGNMRLTHTDLKLENVGGPKCFH